MKTMPKDVTIFDYAAIFGFVAMVPGYVGYHNLYLIGYAPAIFGGISTPLSIISFLVLLSGASLEFIRSGGSVNFADKIFYLFMSVFFGVTIYHYLSFAYKDLAMVHLATMFQMLVYYVIFRRLSSRLDRWRIFFVFSTILISVLIWVGPGQGANVDYDFSLQTETINFRDYQGYALALLISGFAASATMKNYLHRTAIYLIVSAALFFNGARTEFFLAVMVFLFCEFLLSESRLKSLALLGVAAFLSVAGAFAMQLFLEENPAKRILEFLVDPYGDASYLERASANSYGLQTVFSSPLWGDYGNYPLGLYAHNIISSWVDLGFLGFLIYALNIFAPVIGAFRRWLEGAPSARMLLPLALFMGVSVVVSKAFTYKMLGVLAGAYAASLTVGPPPRRQVARRSRDQMVDNSMFNAIQSGGRR